MKFDWGRVPRSDSAFQRCDENPFWFGSIVKHWKYTWHVSGNFLITRVVFSWPCALQSGVNALGRCGWNKAAPCERVLNEMQLVFVLWCHLEAAIEIKPCCARCCIKYMEVLAPMSLWSIQAKERGGSIIPIVYMGNEGTKPWFRKEFKLVFKAKWKRLKAWSCAHWTHWESSHWLQWIRV